MVEPHYIYLEVLDILILLTKNLKIVLFHDFLSKLLEPTEQQMTIPSSSSSDGKIMEGDNFPRINTSIIYM